MTRYCILGMRVDPTSYAEVTSATIAWARESRSRMIAIANVHMTMETYDDPSFREIINEADLVTPDGMPLVWMLRLLGARNQARVYGPDLTLHVCEAAAWHNVPVGFFGGAPDVLEQLVFNLTSRFSGLNVVFAESPPFRPLTSGEGESLEQRIKASGVRILFVGLGCPKQERWVAEHRGRLPLVMLGVGAAFDFHARRIRQAPDWLQRSGLEWAFRLAMEPRRLWKRYFKHNPRFIFHCSMQLLGLRRSG